MNENERCCSIPFTGSLIDSAKILIKDSSLVGEGVYTERIEVCRACPEILPLDRCRECGCYVRIKARFNSMSCPLGKW